MAGLSGGTYEVTASVLGHRSSTTAGVRIGNGQVGIFTYRVGTGPITATARGGYSPPSITSAGKDLDYQRFAPIEGNYVFVGPRGYPELDRRSNLDWRAERLFDLGGRQLSVAGDVFNVSDDKAATQVNTMGTTDATTIPIWPDHGTARRATSCFGAVLERFSPRRHCGSP